MLLALLIAAAVPTAADVDALVHDLGSPDPKVRDERAYEKFVDWIYQSKSLTPAQCEALADTLMQNVRKSDNVLLRSFSTLVLSVIAARDIDAPFLDEKRWREMLSTAVAYLHDERDLRGKDPQVGWIHATAHTADLLKFLSRSPRFKPEDQRAVLNAISEKLRGASVVFTFGEDERLARTALAISKRADFDLASFDGFLSGMQKSEEQNVKNFLAKLLVLFDESSAPSDARKSLLAALKDRF
jgi:hypothetical protein